MLAVSSTRLSALTAIRLECRFDLAGICKGCCALVDRAKSSSGKKSSMHLKSLNSKGFSRIVNMANFNG